MKQIFTIALTLISLNALAAFNELECEGTQNSKEIYLEVEQPFPSNSVFKRMNVSLTSEGAEQTFDYTVTSRGQRGFNRIQYTGAGARLEVDLWPDTTPRWGRTYRASFNSSDVQNRTTFNLECRFPNIF